MKSRRGERGNRGLLGLWPGGECSHSGARQGGRSHCWPVLGGAAQLFLPPQPAGRAPVTRLCCPLSSQAWLDSWQTGPCSVLALEGGRQQSLLPHKEKGQVKNKMTQKQKQKRNKSAGAWHVSAMLPTHTTANCIQKVWECSLATRIGRGTCWHEFH